MATVVRHIPTNKKYVLLGTGFGAFQSKSQNPILGNLMSDTTEGQFAMACVCDSQGEMLWVESTHLLIESVDGKTTNEILTS